MRRIYRRLLFFISTTVFLAVAPLVILYAMGYRTVATNVDPIPVGVVLIETFPRRADVLVNNREVGKTPRAIPNIPAGNVHIALTKEGYVTWEKTVPVKPGLVTELRGVRLWLKDRPMQTFAPGAERLALSPNRQLLAVYFGNKTLQIFDQEGVAVTPGVVLRRSPKAMLWAPDNATLLLQNHDLSNDIFSVSAVQPTSRRVSGLQGVTSATWDPRIPGRLLTLNQSGTVRAFNITSQASATIATRATHFATSSRHLFVVNSAGKILQYTLQGVLQRTLPPTISSPVQQLLVTPEGRIALVADNKLFLLRDDQLVEIAATVLGAQWSPDGRMLLIQQDATSLYVYNEADERSYIPMQHLHFVSRLSRPIISPQWFAGGQHVLYQIEDELRVAEIDTRDRAFEQAIDTTNLGEAQAMVGEDGEVLYYLKRSNGQTSVVATTLVGSQ